MLCELQTHLSRGVETGVVRGKVDNVTASRLTGDKTPALPRRFDGVLHSEMCLSFQYFVLIIAAGQNGTTFASSLASVKAAEGAIGFQIICAALAISWNGPCETDGCSGGSSRSNKGIRAIVSWRAGTCL